MECIVPLVAVTDHFHVRIHGCGLHGNLSSQAPGAKYPVPAIHGLHTLYHRGVLPCALACNVPKMATGRTSFGADIMRGNGA
jgi:hypothetical protein